MKKINFAVEDELYAKIKLKVFNKGITMKKYIETLIKKDLKNFNLEIKKKED